MCLNTCHGEYGQIIWNVGAKSLTPFIVSTYCKDVCFCFVSAIVLWDGRDLDKEWVIHTMVFLEDNVAIEAALVYFVFVGKGL